MAWPWLAILAKTVPWAELVRRTPEILAATRRLREATNTDAARDGAPARKAAEPEQLAARIEALEARDQAHAEIVTAMSEQLRQLTDGLQVVAARNRLLTWLVVGLGVAVVVGALLLLAGG